MNRDEMRDHLRDVIDETFTTEADFDADVVAAAVMDVIEDEALDRMANLLLEETNLRAMDFRNGMSMEIGPARALAASFVGAARAMLGEAPNYSETSVEMTTKLAYDPDNPATREKFAFIVQRVAPGKLTPHEARMAAEKRAERAERQLADTLTTYRNEVERLHHQRDRLRADVTEAEDALRRARRIHARNHPPGRCEMCDALNLCRCGNPDNCRCDEVVS